MAFSAAGQQVSEPDVSERLSAWIDACTYRWQEVTKHLPEDAAPRFPKGHYQLAYSILGNFPEPTLPQLRELLTRAESHSTGWPLFLMPYNAEEGPYPVDGAIEANLGASWKESRQHFLGPSHQDFWRVSPAGQAFSTRGFQEDEAERGGNLVLDLTIPIWRVGEGLLHAQRLSQALEAEDADILFRVIYTGLKGRTLTSLSGNRVVFRKRTSQQERFENEVTVQAATVNDLLPEIVLQLLEPLYASFDFFELSDVLVQEELRRMRKNRY